MLGTEGTYLPYSGKLYITCNIPSVIASDAWHDEYNVDDVMTSQERRGYRSAHWALGRICEKE